MKNLIIAFPVLALFTACSKSITMETISGKWSCDITINEAQGKETINFEFTDGGHVIMRSNRNVERGEFKLGENNRVISEFKSFGQPASTVTLKIDKITDTSMTNTVKVANHFLDTSIEATGSCKKI